MKVTKSFFWGRLFEMALIVSLTISNSLFAQNVLYESMSKELAASHPFVSFHVYTEKQKDGLSLWIRHEHIFMNYNDKNAFIVSEILDDAERVSQTYWMSREKYIHINHQAQEITEYDNKNVFWDDYHSFGLMEFIPHTFYYLSYYIYPMKKKIHKRLMNYVVSDIKHQESIRDRGGSYRKIQAVSNRNLAYDPTSGKRTLVYDEVDFFINEDTKVLDSVFAIQYPIGFENWKTIVTIKDIDFSDKRQFVYGLFDYNRKEYTNYSHHDSKNPPLSRRYSSNKSMTEDLINYSLKQLDGETTSIVENDGWLLLNFWAINCPPCVAHLKKMGKEIDSLGCCLLENKGIKVLAINHRSDNVELIRTIAETTNTTSIIYFAKGMGGVINIPSLGYYYLISPDRQIVYETGDLGDYSELLEAKAKYENALKIKNSKP